MIATDREPAVSRVVVDFVVDLGDRESMDFEASTPRASRPSLTDISAVFVERYRLGSR